MLVNLEDFIVAFVTFSSFSRKSSAASFRLLWFSGLFTSMSWISFLACCDMCSVVTGFSPTLFLAIFRMCFIFSSCCSAFVIVSVIGCCACIGSFAAMYA